MLLANYIVLMLAILVAQLHKPTMAQESTSEKVVQLRSMPTTSSSVLGRNLFLVLPRRRNQEDLLRQLAILLSAKTNPNLRNADTKNTNLAVFTTTTRPNSSYAEENTIENKTLNTSITTDISSSAQITFAIDDSTLSETTSTIRSNSMEKYETIKFDLDRTSAISCGVFPACEVEAIRLTNIILGNVTSETESSLLAKCSRPITSSITAITILLCVVIVLGNFLIIIVTFRSTSLQKPHNCFKISLAVADIIAGIVVLPSVIHNILHDIHYDQPNIFPSTVIKIQSTATAGIFGIAGILSTLAAVYSLLLLSLDSFLSIRWPMKYRVEEIMNKTRAIVAIASIWFISFVVSVFPIFAPDFIEYGLNYITLQYLPVIKANTQAGSISRYWHAIVYAVVVWGMPFVITWIFTIFTLIEGKRILKGMRLARRHTLRSAKNLTKMEQDIRRTVSVVLLLFTITILPVIVTLIYLIVKPTSVCLSKPTALVFFVTSYVLICGRFLNVVIYNVTSQSFRDGLKKLFEDISIFITCTDKATRNMTSTYRSSQKPFGHSHPLNTKSARSSKQITRQSDLSNDQIISV